MKLTLPIDSDERKRIPIRSGCLDYFPAAIAGVAMHSVAGNDKHNPGEPLHHARGKSMDHADCIDRHLTDIADMLARRVVWTAEEEKAILAEANALCWRALALSQELHEKFGAPLAPRARLPQPEKNRKEANVGIIPYSAGVPDVAAWSAARAATAITPLERGLNWVEERMEAGKSPGWPDASEINYLASAGQEASKSRDSELTFRQSCHTPAEGQPSAQTQCEQASSVPRGDVRHQI